jgi:hypothetical protein
MSEKRYVTPDAMLDVVYSTIENSGLEFGEGEKLLVCAALDASIKWLAENPIVPTEQEYRDFGVKFDFQGVKCIAEWQRRMFLAPEPEVPEAIKDLMCGGSGAETGTPEQAQARVNARILTAYHRGQRAGKP